MSRNSITPARAFLAIGELVSTTGGSPFGPGRRSLTAMAQEAVGLGGPPFTSTRHMRQLPATESRSWKQKRGISAPAASQACSSVYSAGTSISLPSTMILVMRQSPHARHFPLPPCGGGLGRGVAQAAESNRPASQSRRPERPPTPALPHKGGGRSRRLSNEPSSAFLAHPKLDVRQVRPAERLVAVAELAEMFKPRLRLFKARDMPGRHEPHNEMRSRQLLEPRGFRIVDARMHRVPHEFLERLDALPNGQIDRQHRIGERADRGRVVAFVLEAPDKALAAFGDGVDSVEIVHEPGHARIVGRMPK